MQPRPNRRHAGLFLKYFAFIGLLVSAGLLASGAIGLYFSYEESRRSLESLQREKALTAAVRIEHFLRDAEDELAWTALPFPGGVDESRERRLNYIRLLRLLPAATEVTWLDGAGREQLKISRLEMDEVGRGIDYSRDPRFVEARKGHTWFGPVEFRDESEPYMPIAIAEGPGRPGVTVVDLNLKFIWDVVSAIHIGKKGFAYVADKGGTLIAHPDMTLALRKLDIARLAHGASVLSADAVVEPTGWRVFVEQPASEALAPLYGAVLRTAFLLLAGLVLSLAASLVLARRMVRPVRALQRGTELVESGDLTKRIEVRTGDELEELAGRFNAMTEQLRQSYADLEKKVELRTAELREALDQQTATAEILRVITRSPNDVQPVLQAIVEAAQELASAGGSALVLYDGIHLRSGADTEGIRPKEYLPDQASMSGRVVLSGQVVQIEDLAADATYERSRFDPQGLEAGINKRLVGVPLLRDGAAIGVLTVWWPGAGAIEKDYVRLLQTFADQAVIAIENVRLFNEIRQKSRELEVANRHKSEFLAHMSHELRTPLNAIIGFSDMLLSGLAGAMAGKQKEFVGDIRDSGRHLLALINDILDLSRIEAGRMDLDVARFDLRRATETAMTLVRGRAERQGVALDADIAPDVGEYDGDERKFKQILLNLLTNAVKFTPEGGSVHLAAERVDGAYVFSVKDTGIGIAPEDQQAIFEEFRQVVSDPERKAEGSGLGLALARQLVELHGGRIRVESAPGQGSTFTFDLPIAAQ